MIIIDDVVTVTLKGGGILNKAIVKVVPGNNQIYWTFETKDGATVVVGPSLILIKKIS